MLIIYNLKFHYELSRANIFLQNVKQKMSLEFIKNYNYNFKNYSQQKKKCQRIFIHSYLNSYCHQTKPKLKNTRRRKNKKSFKKPLRAVSDKK